MSTAEQTPLLTLEHGRVQFGERDVLSDIHLQLHRRQITTLIGPNGSGKSTLARVILGLQSLSHGSLQRQNKLRIGYMPQKLKIDDTLPLTVERFIRLACSSTSQAKAALDKTGARSLAKQAIQSLSGGQLQRVLLARALVREPQLLVLDEPAQGVDISGQNEMYQLIADIRDETSCAVLLISHDLHLVMAASDQVICLNHHICCSGTPEAVSNDPSYLAIFGEQADSAVGVYRHHHDHSHALDGSCEHEHHTEDTPTSGEHSHHTHKKGTH